MSSIQRSNLAATRRATRATRHHTLTGLCLAAALAGPPLAQAASITDPAGDFLATFAGSSASADLDVLSATVTYNPGTDFYTLSSTQAGAVGSTAAGFYVWGVNRGAGVANFAANGVPGVRFDSVVFLRPNGTGSVGATPLPAGSVTISGNTITGVVSGSLLPSTGFAKIDYTWNLWPRDGAAGTGFVQISDFAPDNSNFTATVVPEPATTAMLLAGVAALLGLRRRRAERVSSWSSRPCT